MWSWYKLAGERLIIETGTLPSWKTHQHLPKPVLKPSVMHLGSQHNRHSGQAFLRPMPAVSETVKYFPQGNYVFPLCVSISTAGNVSNVQ